MWWRHRTSQDFSDEVQAHLTLEIDRLRQEGLSEEQAAFAARRTMGNVTAIEERFYEAHYWNWLDQLCQDVRGCFRQWRKRPVVATAALLTIALGTGMNVALFQIVWSVLLKQLPYPNASRLVQVWQVDRTTGGFAPPDRRLPNAEAIEVWRARSRTFEGVASYQPWMTTVASGGDPERIRAGRISAEYFQVLGTDLLQGRAFTPAETRAGSDDVVVLSYGYWTRRFGGDRGLVGKPILIDGEPCRVVGILAAGFRDLVVFKAEQPDIYVPISRGSLMRRPLGAAYVVGRLRDELGIEAARSESLALARQAVLVRGKRPSWDGVNITRLQDEVGLALRPSLLVLFAATGCILLIACTNVANLLLSQAVGRRQELAIRAAVGAGRWRLIRQLLTEALVLALAGTWLGLGAAWVLSRGLVALYPGKLPRVEEGGDGGAVLLFAVAVAVLTTVFFGILPAVLATKRTGSAGLRAGRMSLGRGAGRWRETLIGLQVALTATVLISAGLLLKSLAALRAVDLGFARAQVFTAQVVLPQSRYRTPEDFTSFAGLWVERLRSIPGVERAAVINSLPLAANLLMTVRFSATGQPEEHTARCRAVAGDYFAALGLRMKEGRPLAAADDGRRDVAVVNEAFARQFVKDSPAAGTVLRFGDKWTASVVGVVRDLRNEALTRPAEPEMYVPFAAQPGPFLDVVVRSAAPPSSIAAAARAQLRSLDSGLALDKVATMDSVVDNSIAGPRFRALLLGMFAAVAVALAIVGIYGVIAQGVRARTTEFGVRIALGASPAAVFWLVVKRGLRAPLVGLVAGLAAAWATGHMLESLLFAVKPRDAFVLASSTALVVAACLASCALPARRACRTDAARALRDE